MYVLDTESGGSSSLCSTESENTYISSVQWNKSGKYLAVGTSSAEVQVHVFFCLHFQSTLTDKDRVQPCLLSLASLDLTPVTKPTQLFTITWHFINTQLWDVNVSKLVRRMHTHETRVNTLAWNPCTNLLSSASQSGTIHNYDVRLAQFHVGSIKSHSVDVCGLRWSPNGRFLASGGDSNVVCLWDTHSRDPWTTPIHILKEHAAAVKVEINFKCDLCGLLVHA